MCSRCEYHVFHPLCSDTLCVPDVAACVTSNVYDIQGYECVAPDLLGHGFSSAPGSPRHYSFQWLLEHVRSVFKKYATSRRRVVVIGHSYG